jgi:hypothetical protein
MKKIRHVQWVRAQSVEPSTSKKNIMTRNQEVTHH